MENAPQNVPYNTPDNGNNTPDTVPATSEHGNPEQVGIEEQGELFSLRLRLHPIASGEVFPGSGHQVQAAFLDIVRQIDPELSEYLHTPNQRHPYTLSLLQGFNHIEPADLAEIMSNNRSVAVQPEQTYWTRITTLRAEVFHVLSAYLILHAQQVTVQLNNTKFAISRLLAAPETQQNDPSWVGYTSFAKLSQQRKAYKEYRFEFASPTAFSKGQKSWGKMLSLFPMPEEVFESLGTLWDVFAPPSLSLSAHDITPAQIAAWCHENVIVTQYALETRYLASRRFGQAGFQGQVTYEVKGDADAREAQWLTPLAQFALFGGVGYKTAMGMGQCRCLPYYTNRHHSS